MITLVRGWRRAAVALAAFLILGPGTAPSAGAQNQSLQDYCSGPGRDYNECMRRGELSQGLSPGLRDFCSRPGTNFEECVERYVNRGSIDDMSAYCSQPGRAYRSCMEDLLDGGRGNARQQNDFWGGRNSYDRRDDYYGSPYREERPWRW